MGERENSGAFSIDEYLVWFQLWMFCQKSLYNLHIYIYIYIWLSQISASTYIWMCARCIYVCMSVGFIRNFYQHTHICLLHKKSLHQNTYRCVPDLCSHVCTAACFIRNFYQHRHVCLLYKKSQSIYVMFVCLFYQKSLYFHCMSVCSWEISIHTCMYAWLFYQKSQISLCADLPVLLEIFICNVCVCVCMCVCCVCVSLFHY